MIGIAWLFKQVRIMFIPLTAGRHDSHDWVMNTRDWLCVIISLYLDNKCD